MRRFAAADPLIAALVFQAMLIPLALGLAVLLGLRPWAQLRPSADIVLLALAATAPLAAALAVLESARPDWFRELDALVRQLIERLFRGRGMLPVVVISALAGLGEELLFRGVVQAALVGWLGAGPGVVLGAIVFGLAHYLSRAYFLLATGMGLYLGALYQMTGNLLLPVLVHGIYDAVAIAWLLRSRGRTLDGPL